MSQAEALFSGKYVTFDGAMYNFHALGEYTLFGATTGAGTAVQTSLRQQVIAPDIMGTGIDAFSIKVGSNQLEIYAGQNNDDIKGSAYLNNEVIGFEKMKNLTNMVYSRVGINSHQIDVDGELQIWVTVEGRFLRIKVNAQKTVTNVVGLLGNNDDEPLNDFKKKDGSSGGNLNQTTIHTVFGASWNVTSADSLFRAIPSDQIKPAGTALCFESSSAVSPVLKTWVSTGSITFDFHFEMSSNMPSGTCGAVMSYRFTVGSDEHVTTVLICQDGYVAFAFDDSTFRLDGSLVHSVWYHGFLMSDPTIKQIVFYIYDASNGNLISTIPIQSAQLPSYNPFTPGGTIVLGQWNAPDSLTYGLGWNFVGCLDEIRIWNKKLNVQQHPEYKSKYSSISTPDLVHYFRLNDGVGSYALDSITGERLTLIGAPWRSPMWKKSTTTLSIPSDRVLDTYSALKTAGNASVTKFTTFCRCNLDKVKSNGNCQSMGAAAFQFLEEQCVFNSLLFDDSSFGLDIILSASSQCKYVNKLSSEPSQSLCNNFPGRFFPDVMGANCDKKCYSGKRINGVCECYEGFYGPTCAETCMSANKMPCGAGTCDKTTGMCECPGNFDAATACKTCKSGWNGKDCSTAQSGKIATTTHDVCAFFAKSHFVNIKGMAFDMEVPGEFLLLDHSAWKVYIRQIPCGNEGATCINQILVVYGANKLAVHGVYPVGDSPVIFQDGNIANFTLEKTVGNVAIKKESPTKITLTHTSNHKITVNAIDRFLDVEIQMKKGGCNSMTGICGNCQTDKDFQTATNTYVKRDDITGDIIKTDFANYHKVSSVGFVYSVTIATQDLSSSVAEAQPYSPSSPAGGSNCASAQMRYIRFEEPVNMNTLASYMVKIEKAVLQAGPLTKSFDQSKDVTIEIKVNAANSVTDGGVIWSYVADSRMTLSNYNGKIKFMVNGESHMCNFTTETDKWNHLTLVYNRATGLTKIYNFYNKSHADECTVTVTPNLFKNGGTFSLGGEIPKSGENSTLAETSFVGAVDEVRIWNRGFNKYLIMQNTEFDVSGFPDLVTYWKFSEGAEFSSLDNINNYQMVLPQNGKASWWVSTASLVNAPVSVSTDPYQFSEAFDSNTNIVTSGMSCTAERNALATSVSSNSASSSTSANTGNSGSHQSADDIYIDQVCSELFNHALTVSGSQLIGSGLRQFFLIQCKGDMSNSVDDSRLRALMSTISMFVRYASTIDNPVSNLTATLCNLNSDLKQLSMCKQSDSCKFGSLENGVCTCSDGYWGSDCGNVCPLGPDGTCGCNGKCNVTSGQCECPDTYTVASHCIACASDFTGPKCDIVLPPTVTVPTTDSTCSMFGSGQYMNFMSYVRQIEATSVREIYFVKPSQAGDFEVQMRTAHCYGSSSCMTAIAVKSGSNVIVLRAPYTSSSEDTARIWINNQRNTEDIFGAGKTVGNLKITQESCYAYSITDSQFNYEIKIKIWKKFISSATIKTPVATCGTSESVCGCCNATTCVPGAPLEFAVDSSDSLFGPVYINEYGEKQIVGGGGTCLKFDDTQVSSTLPLKNTFSNTSDITIKFYVSRESSRGILLSYSHATTFTVYLDTTLKVQVHDTKFDTGFTLDQNTWYQIVIVYQSDNAIFTVYVLSTSDVPRYKGYTSPRTDVFSTNGILSFGRFAPVLEGAVSAAVTEPFVGLMDEVSVWHRVFQFAEVLSSFQTALSPKLTNLKGLWTFDDGDGNRVRSSFASDNDMYIQQYLWSKIKPAWVFSEAPINLILSQTSYTFDSTDLEQSAQTMCSTVLKSSQMTGTCTSFTSSQRDVFVVMCKRQIALTRDVQSALMTLDGMADACMLKQSLASSPAKKLCTHFDGQYFPKWTGPTCDRECHCGSYDSTLTSQCSCK